MSHLAAIVQLAASVLQCICRRLPSRSYSQMIHIQLPLFVLMHIGKGLRRPHCMPHCIYFVVAVLPQSLSAPAFGHDSVELYLMVFPLGLQP